MRASRAFSIGVSRVYTVLVCNDDAEMLEVVSAILREPGYTVVTARDGYDAIGILADRHIDLLLTDVRMPGLDGMQLAKQAKVMRPNLRIVYISGFSDAAAKVRAGCCRSQSAPATSSKSSSGR
jgi:CheY-like chemotaxis protein